MDKSETPTTPTTIDDLRQVKEEIGLQARIESLKTINEIETLNAELKRQDIELARIECARRNVEVLARALATASSTASDSMEIIVKGLTANAAILNQFAEGSTKE